MVGKYAELAELASSNLTAEQLEGPWCGIIGDSQSRNGDFIAAVNECGWNVVDMSKNGYGSEELSILTASNLQVLRRMGIAPIRYYVQNSNDSAHPTKEGITRHAPMSRHCTHLTDIIDQIDQFSEEQGVEVDVTITPSTPFKPDEMFPGVAKVADNKLSVEYAYADGQLAVELNRKYKDKWLKEGGGADADSGYGSDGEDEDDVEWEAEDKEKPGGVRSVSCAGRDKNPWNLLTAEMRQRMTQHRQQDQALHSDGIHLTKAGISCAHLPHLIDDAGASLDSDAPDFDAGSEAVVHLSDFMPPSAKIHSILQDTDDERKCDRLRELYGAPTASGMGHFVDKTAPWMLHKLRQANFLFGQSRDDPESNDDKMRERLDLLLTLEEWEAANADRAAEISRMAADAVNKHESLWPDADDGDDIETDEPSEAATGVYEHRGDSLHSHAQTAASLVGSLLQKAGQWLDTRASEWESDRREQVACQAGTTMSRYESVSYARRRTDNKAIARPA